MKLKTMQLEIQAVRCLSEGGETAALSDNTLDSYRHVLEETRTCTSLSVCFDGQDYWLFDGYHRLEAMKRLGFNSCRVTIFKGSRRDAYRRYVKDKLRRIEPPTTSRVFRHCLERLKIDPEWSSMAPKELARLFGRNSAFFENLRSWEPGARNDEFAFSRCKHGSVTLRKRRISHPTPSRPREDGFGVPILG